MSMTRYPALDADGQPCTIVCQQSALSASHLSGHYAKKGLGQWLTSDGQRLNPTDDPKVFRLVRDPRRTFTRTD